MSSVLKDVKRSLGLEEDYTPFDSELILNINTAIFKIRQIGVNYGEKLRINGYDETWEDILGPDDDGSLESVKSFISLEVKLMFDPPSTSFVIDAYKGQLEELTVRINMDVENRED